MFFRISGIIQRHRLWVVDCGGQHCRSSFAARYHSGQRGIRLGDHAGERACFRLAGSAGQGPERGAAFIWKHRKIGRVGVDRAAVAVAYLGGCSQTTVARNIVNWTPALQSAVATVNSAGALLAPTDAQVFAAATAGFNAASNLLSAQAKAYLANPSASTLAQMQNQVVTFQQQVNAALLQAARIVNPASQQHALETIQAVGTVVTAILALVQSVSNKAAIAQMAARSTIKMAAVRPYLNEMQAAGIVAGHYDEPVALARMQVAHAEQYEVQAGF